MTIPKIYNGEDRTFWFFGWQRQNERASESATSSVPTPEMLNGDFSFLNTLGPNGGPFQLYDPYSTRLTTRRTQTPGYGTPPGKQDSSPLISIPWQRPFWPTTLRARKIRVQS